MKSLSTQYDLFKRYRRIDLDESVFVGNNSISQQQSSSQRQLVSSLPQLNMGTNYAMVKHVLTPIINLFILNGFV